MFTGLIQDLGKVVQVLSGPTTDFWLRTQLPVRSFAMGESIAVDGACLTVVEMREDTFRVQASAETLQRTTLGSLVPGMSVHLERALQVGDRLGGHMVLGHVDGIARVRSGRAEAGSWLMEIELPTDLAPFFVPKGSVTVDGVSLTVNVLGRDAFSLTLIPETRARTHLESKRPGAAVNLEADVIGKYVARLYALGERPSGSGLTPEAVRTMLGR